ncbi:MAG: ADP-forming succinate--CoA ligase subunit beta [candidate division Zixibacteria bacterium]|nr:ADP-forming succinate--CoA ligase subunit beta [candidate division Zixibacteria bacterium]
MNIHEYQAKETFVRYGILVPRGAVASTPERAREIAAEYGTTVVVKAQVHVGGRGKAGGVKLASTPDEAFEKARNILGMDIKGLTVRQTLIAEAVDIAHEAYVGIILDRASKRPVFMVSAAGGIDIEEVARETPEKIHKLAVDPFLGLQPYQARALAYRLYDHADQANQAAKILSQLYRVFVESDASLAEINPLVTTPDGKVWAVDGKINIDDNALYRQSAIAAMRDLDAEASAEVTAREAGLSFVKLEGDIGCVVNGAGLAMATMDLVKYYGGQPANFLDIGGSSNPDKVVAAMNIITSDPKVKAILFNIFGGITRCDDVANGIVTALKRIAEGSNGPLTLPIVIRLTGTNEAEGRRILNEVNLVATDDMSDAVQRVIALSRQN